MDEKIKFNIRGTMFVTRKSTIENLVPSRLSRLTTDSNEYEKNTDEYFYDRNPSYFNWILDIHSSGEIHVPSWMCPTRALQELEFWEISCKVQSCCWKTLYENDNSILKNLMAMNSAEVTSSGNKVWSEKNCGIQKDITSAVAVLRDAYNHPFRSRVGKVCFGLVLMLTLTSIFTYALNAQSITRVRRSDEELRDIYENLRFSYYEGDYLDSANGINGGDDTNQTYIDRMSQLDDKGDVSSHGECGERSNSFSVKTEMYGMSRMHPVLWYIEVIVNSLLLIEFILRLCLSPKKFRFLTNPLNVCDILSIVAFIFVIYFDEDPSFFTHKYSKPILMLLGIVYTARVLRILRLAFYVDEMKILVFSLKSSFRMLSFLFICFMVFSVLFGFLMYSFELFSQDTFENVFISVWWALVTMSTVGYGDEYPKTPQGYVLGSVTTMFGIVLIAMPIAILSTNFNAYYCCYKLKVKALSCTMKPWDKQLEHKANRNISDTR
ncbi:potassium voltage-gated channel subfamily C member 3-like [Pecten maximus]|uniref:potassium voltage-gated channel subfamily C member 3-like n=1 Tax=Pecten maximus TaxID=6579 RepID=UPI0014585A80|nr:potassium voltage-gated channel subfamily C member 3-like [Pecten maximus]